MAARTCPACQRRYAGLIDPDCVICGGIGVLSLGAAGLHKNEPAVAARAIEVYLEATARNASENLPIGSARSEAIAAAVAELRHGGLIADTLTTVSTVHELPTSRPRLTVVTAADTHPAATLRIRCGIARRDLGTLHREDLVPDLLGWTLVIRTTRGLKLTPLPDDIATLILDHPPGLLFPALADEYANVG